MGDRHQGLPSVLADLLEATVGVADLWTGLDVDTLTVAEAGALLEALDRQVNRLEGARCKLAGSFARRDGHRRSGHRDLAGWLQDRLRRSPTQARKEARTAQRLADLSATGKALDDGDISLEHAAAVADETARAEDPRAAQRSLLDEARAGDPRRVRKAGKRLRADEARRAEQDRRARMAVRQRTLSFRADEDEKTVWIAGRLPMVAGVKVRAAVDALAGRTGPDDQRSYGQRLADGLVELVDRAADGRGLPPQRGLPVEVMAVVPVEAIERRAGVERGTLTGGPGGGIDLCDVELAELIEMAGLSWLIVDPAGVPLRYGRTWRFASPDQRRVLRARDGGCAWPGCDAPAVWMLAHHEPPFDGPGGATDLARLVGLCGTHHGLRHDGGWTVAIDRTATVTVTSPDGATVLVETAAQRRARHGTCELSTDRVRPRSPTGRSRGRPPDGAAHPARPGTPQPDRDRHTGNPDPRHAVRVTAAHPAGPDPTAAPDPTPRAPPR